MKEQPFASGLQLMFTPQAFFPFLTGSLALAVAGNTLYQFLAIWIGSHPQDLMRIFIGAILILGLAAFILSKYINRMRPAPPMIRKKAPFPHKGLILLVSNETTSRKAIDWHRQKLDRCWLLCSTRTLSIAQKIEEELNSSGKSVKYELVDDVFDPLECRDKVERIYQALPEDWKEDDVILDFTGMTACASVGSVLACLDEKRAIQYTPGQYNEALKVMQPLEPVEIVLHWEKLRGAPPSGKNSP